MRRFVSLVKCTGGLRSSSIFGDGSLTRNVLPYLTGAIHRTSGNNNDNNPNSNANNNNRSNNNKKMNNNPNNNNNDGDEEEDESYYFVRNMMLRFAVGAGVFYYLSLPKGTHLSVQEVRTGHANENYQMHFLRATVYNRYVQWYEDDVVSHFYTAIPNVHHFDTAILPQLAEQHPGIQVRYAYTSWSEWAVSAVSILVWVVPLFFMPIVLSSITRPVMPSMMGRGEGKVQNVRKSMSFTPTTSNMCFNDVIGMSEAKQEVMEFIEFLGDPTRFHKLGAQIPNGALLLGPPGVGKTLLAKAMAGEARASFIACCGSDFVELYAGMGALRVRKLFEQAQAHSPCIIYIDEIDAIGMKRTGDVRGGGQEREHTLNQLLALLDGFSKKNNVITVASTNAPVSMLDPALVRPGRLDRIINIERPLIREREELFEFYLGKINLIPDVAYMDSATPSTFPQEDVKKKEYLLKQESYAKDLTLYVPPTNTTFGSTRVESAEAQMKNNPTIVKSYAKRLAQLCPGFTGADARNVCNESAILAARNNMTFVDIHCLERAVDRVLAGIEKRSQVLTPFEKKVVAHHEAGHAVVSWFLSRADPLMKVSIVPRGGKALGYAQYLPSENFVQTEKEMFDDLCVLLGGRAAEVIFFNHLSTGAQDDLSKVRRISYTLAATYGRIPGLDTSHAPPGTGDSIYSKPFSDSVAQRIDDESKRVVDRAYDTAIRILTEHKEKTAAIAHHLLVNELLTRDDVTNILGPRPFRQEGFEEVPMVTPMAPSHPLRRTERTTNTRSNENPDGGAEDSAGAGPQVVTATMD